MGDQDVNLLRCLVAKQFNEFDKNSNDKVVEKAEIIFALGYNERIAGELFLRRGLLLTNGEYEAFPQAEEKALPPEPALPRFKIGDTVRVIDTEHTFMIDHISWNGKAADFQFWKIFVGPNDESCLDRRTGFQANKLILVSR